MAEPSLEYLKLICDIFVSKYNAIHNTNFQFLGRETHPCDIDFYIGDDNNKIGIQFSRIQSTPNWFKSSSDAVKLVEKIREVGNRSNLKCMLHVVFSAIPSKEPERERFVSSLIRFLDSHLKNTTFKMKFKKEWDLGIFNNVFSVLSEFEIRSLKSDNFFLTWGHIDWECGRTIDEEVNYLLDLIIKKNDNYSPESKNITLLFETDPIPVDDIELNELRTKCRSKEFNFSEVWLINSANNGYCDIIYPFSE